MPVVLTLTTTNLDPTPHHILRNQQQLLASVKPSSSIFSETQAIKRIIYIGVTEQFSSQNRSAQILIMVMDVSCNALINADHPLHLPKFSILALIYHLANQSCELDPCIL